MSFSLATWNINSVRLREPTVLKFLEEQQPDILCLQEIKCQNDQFPMKNFKIHRLNTNHEPGFMQ